MTRTFTFGTQNSSRKLRTVKAELLEDAVLEFSVTELYPEHYVKREMVSCIVEERPWPYDPVLELKDDASIEVYENVKGELRLATVIPVSSVLHASIAEDRRLLPGVTAEGTSLVENDEDRPLTKERVRAEMDTVLRRKMELEAQLDELKSRMAEMDRRLSDAAKTLRLMKNYAGVEAEVVQICDGAPADESVPLTVYQSKLYMDENVGILGLFEGGEDSLDVHNLDEFDRWISQHYRTFMPAEKALTVWQIRREAKHYAFTGTPEADLFNSVMNQGNFRTYFLIRNGERLWRFTSGFHVPDEIFPKLGEKRDWSTESRMKDDAEKRLFALAALQGIIDHTDILGLRLREKGVNLLSPALDEDDVMFVRDAEPGQFITDGRMRWRDWLRANQDGVHRGSRIMPLVGWGEITGSDGLGDWRITRSASERTKVYEVPDKGTVYDVEAVVRGYWGGDMLKILFNPKDEVYRYRGDWVSGHERMVRIGFLYSRDEVIDVDEVTYEDLTYYLSSRLDRPDYASMLPLLARLWKWKRKEHDEETPFAMLLASRAGLDWPEDEERIRETIHWWKTKNRMRRAVTKDDALAFRMCLKKLKETNDGEDDGKRQG